MFNIERSSRGERDFFRPRRPTTIARLTKRIVATSAIIAASLLGAVTSSAVADTSALKLGCYVDSRQFDVVQADYCFSPEPRTSYTVRFEVMGRSAGVAYAYSWNTSGSTVVYGCTASSFDCGIRVDSRFGWSRTVSVHVTEVATGASKTVTALAEGETVCGAPGSLYWC